jgi:hypothetical protein
VLLAEEEAREEEMLGDELLAGDGAHTHTHTNTHTHTHIYTHTHTGILEETIDLEANADLIAQSGTKTITL